MAQELSTDAGAPSALELEGRYRPGLVAQVHDRLSQLALSRSATVYFMRAMRRPSRSVRSTAKSMSGSYPSRKMGAGIGFESRTIEYPMVLSLEHDPDVLAYLDQPPQVKIVHKVRGRQRGFMQTPDFLVLRQSEVALIECKRLGEILDRQRVDPSFFVEARGKWTCPPAQVAAEALGFKHEVWTERDFNKIRLRNRKLTCQADS